MPPYGTVYILTNTVTETAKGTQRMKTWQDDRDAMDAYCDDLDRHARERLAAAAAAVIAAVPCPNSRCQAKVGEPCRDAGNPPTDRERPHHSRVLDWDDDPF